MFREPTPFSSSSSSSTAACGCHAETGNGVALAANLHVDSPFVASTLSGASHRHPGRTEPVAKTPPPVDLPRIERAVREILLAIGEDPHRDGLKETPRRVAKAYSQIFSGLREDAATHLARVFQEQTDDTIICRDIEFYTVCEHHLLPFFGKVHIAYKPDGRQVVGLSKLARTVEVFARRPQVQERLTNQIADALMQFVTPQGVAVIIEAEHLCMKMRGVGKQGSDMVTTAYRGCFKDATPARTDVLNMMLRKQR